MKISGAFLLSIALFVLSACGGQPGTRDVTALRAELQKHEQKSWCVAALELGKMKDQESIRLLAAMAENDKGQIRKCALEALRWYEDPGFCQDFYEYWLGDPDEEVRKAAGITIVANNCESEITRRGDYAMDAKSCGYTQHFINGVQKAIAEASGIDGWKEILPALNIRDIIVDAGTPEEILQMRLNLAFAVLDWGESVASIHSFENRGSLAENKSSNLEEIEVYTKKQEYIKQFCPLAQFPDFAYWNEVITGESIEAGQ